MRVALKFAYDGRSFHGYARQPKLLTIEQTIIDNLINLNYIADPTISTFQSASRTDKKVSALGNVIAFNTDKSIANIIGDINLRDDIVFYGKKIVDDDFYPRYANHRIYRYYLKDINYDFSTLMDTLSIYIGSHNFSNFARVESQKNPIRTIDNITVERMDDFFLIDFYAQTYLWHQIRRIISAVQKRQENKITHEMIVTALSNPEQKVDFGLARSEPLILKDILYPFAFHIDKEGIKKKTKLKNHLLNQI